MDNFERTPILARWLHVAVIAVFALVLRCSSISVVYFEDSFRHVNAIANGSLIIQPPGYFLFNLTGFVTYRLLHLSIPHALDLINVVFGVSGVVAFYALCCVLFEARHAFMLSLVYACSPVTWFASDIQCSYAAQTLLAPLLLYLVRGKKYFVWGCLVWAVLAGFRPSDGVFVLPWMLYESIGVTWSARLKGALLAVAGGLLWWIPTAQRYGGGFLSPITRSRGQAAALAQGVFTGEFSLYSLANFVRAWTSFILAWGILTPLVVIAIVWLWRRDGWVRSLTIWMIPGVLFFLFYYISDAVLFSFCVAPGLIVAGCLLAGIERKTWRTGIYSLAVACSLIFMFGARPVSPKTKSGAVVDAWFVSFTAWALRHQYGPSLRELIGTCAQPGMLDARGAVVSGSGG